MSNSVKADPAKEGKPLFSSSVSAWIGILTSLITVVLAIYTTSNKARLDSLETNFKDRSTKVEESKERVERYKWVYGLYSELNSNDPRKKNFTIGLITLALNDDEAKKLFSGLQASNDPLLQSVGQSGLKVIGNEQLVALVAKLDTTEKQSRVDAATVLESKYAASPAAISLVLNLYNADNIKTLSPDGIINGLYYLNRSDPKVWNNQQIEQGNEIAARIMELKPGPNTTIELSKFRSFLKIAAKGR